MANLHRTALLIGVLTALFLVIGHLLGGPRGAFFALALALGLNFFAYWNSDKIILSLYNAQEVTHDTAPDLHRIVRQLVDNVGMPMPRVYIIDSEQPNAFATGRNPENGAIAVTTGLMNILDQRELASVIAHELAHILNRDTLTMTITATLAGAIGYLVQLPFLFASRNENGERSVGPIAHLLIMILAPMVAFLIQMAISRTREYSADAIGAQICLEPLALASALQKIEAYAHQVINQRAEDNPATAHLFIINPLSRRAIDNLFATHPNTQNRIARLEKMAQQAPRSPIPSVIDRPGPWSRS